MTMQLIKQLWKLCILVSNIIFYSFLIFHVLVDSFDSSNKNRPTHGFLVVTIFCMCWQSPRIVGIVVKGAEVWRVEVYFGQADESMAGQLNRGRECEDLFFANFIGPRYFCWMHCSSRHCDPPPLYSKPPLKLVIHRHVDFVERNRRIHSTYIKNSWKMVRLGFSAIRWPT